MAALFIVFAFLILILFILIAIKLEAYEEYQMCLYIIEDRHSNYIDKETHACMGNVSLHGKLFSDVHKCNECPFYIENMKRRKTS